MFKQFRPALVSVLVFGVTFGLLFPAVITGIAEIVFPHQAGGSLIERNGIIIGSELIGQNFTRPEYFHPRPSAAGSGYDGASSGGTNLGPTSDKLINGIHKKLADGNDDPGNYEGIKDLAASFRAENGLGPGTPLPAEAVTRSASGLDPHLSPANAILQIPRVARARQISEEKVRQAVEQHLEGRTLGLLGEPRINVFLLNLALDSTFGVVTP
jgi:K+-transporting ATPase ATPase C chain